MKMRWIYFTLMILAMHSVSAEEFETNEVSTPPKINLDGNLRRALLKALTELEHDDKENSDYQFEDGLKEKIIEKAHASSVSIFANSEYESSSSPPTTTTAGTTTTAATTTTEKSLVILQKSEGVQHPSIVTLEKDGEEPEQILTSASNSFTNQPYQNSIHDKKAERSSLNSIQNTNEGTTKLKRVEPTTTIAPPTVSTEESEAKVEDVQFFPAPLVAAFTVHQDELGQPKKVEPIYKANSPKVVQVVNSAEQGRITQAEREQIRHLQLEQDRLKLEELRRQQLKFQQYQQELRQKSLEQEIIRLNLSLKQQEQIHLRQQEELRTRVNVQPFPVVNPGFRNNGFLVTQQPPFRASNQFNTGQVFVQPSLTFDPLLEAGKLPANAQVLPVRGPIDFQSPFVTFPLNNFQQDPNNRFFRQTSGTGNFGVNDQNSFSIQQSVQPSFDNLAEGNRFFRSNGESTLTSPQFLQPPQPQNNRFFRSNLESTFGSPSNNFYKPQPQGNNNNQLNNLLHNSGAFRGKSPEDLNLISKVLSLNHVGDNGNFVRQNQRPYSTIF